MIEQWELVEYDCQDGECLMIHEKTYDSKLGALSLDHRDIGEAIIEELNKKEQRLPHLRDELHDLFKGLKYDSRTLSERALVEMIYLKVFEILREVFEE